MRIVLYADRGDAGLALATELKSTLRPPCVVVGIPRGGVIVAEPIATRLALPLTLTFVHKAALPAAPEVAVGAMDEDGHLLVDDERYEPLLGASHDLASVRSRVLAEIQRQRRAFPAAPLDEFLPGSTVVLVDDGLATGLTMRAAVAHARRRWARHVVVAVPCASERAAAVVRREADQFVCPYVDPEFMAVAAYYRDFEPVHDAAVVAALERARHQDPGRAG